MTGERSRVLVVDDEPGVRLLVRRLLNRDCEVLEAQDGVEAVDLARSQKPDLILMDMMMPKMDGLSACCAIKQDAATKDIPVVMLTAVAYELNQRLSQSVMGASGYITKPFTVESLLSTVRPLISAKRDEAGEMKAEHNVAGDAENGKPEL